MYYSTVAFMTEKNDRRFYTYIHFDWTGVPRWVGKGTGDRIDHHEKTIDDSNPEKNEFIEQTWIMLGEVPKLKVRENLTKEEALETEIALITAIGRADQGKGPLVNKTNGGDGALGFNHSIKTLKLMSQIVKARVANLSAAERVIYFQRMRDAITPEIRKANAIKIHESQTPEQRRERQLKGWITQKLRAKKRHFINNGVICKLVNKDILLPTGWVTGRLIKWYIERNSNGTFRRVYAIKETVD